MADISLCYGLLNTGDQIKDCPVRNECKRFNIKGNGVYQSYFAPPDIRGDGCDMFWEDPIVHLT